MCCRERLPREPSSLFLLHANDLTTTTTRYTLPLRCGLALILLLPLHPTRVHGVGEADIGGHDEEFGMAFCPRPQTWLTGLMVNHHFRMRGPFPSVEIVLG